MIVAFQVHGVPKPKGSKTKGRQGHMYEANPGTMPWVKAVREASRKAMGGDTKPRVPFNGPVKVIAYFYLPRPKAHFNSKGELHYWAPLWHAVPSDLDKLQRSIGDALKPFCLTDDARIAHWDAKKMYCPIGQEAHASLEIRELA